MAELNEKKEKEIPDLEVLFDLADLFKVFGDSTRIRIMFAISDMRCRCLVLQRL